MCQTKKKQGRRLQASKPNSKNDDRHQLYKCFMKKEMHIICQASRTHEAANVNETPKLHMVPLNNKGRVPIPSSSSDLVLGLHNLQIYFRSRQKHLTNF